jgi:hypothetical protein
MSTTGDNALLYFKNNETSSVHVDAIAVGIGQETAGTSTDSVYVTLVANPTAGTIISDASPVAMNANRNLGSATSLTDSLAYKGGDTKTMTGGSNVALFQMSGEGRLFAPINMVVPKGKSIGILIDLNGVTANVYGAIIVHLHDSKED